MQRFAPTAIACDGLPAQSRPSCCIRLAPTPLNVIVASSLCFATRPAAGVVRGYIPRIFVVVAQPTLVVWPLGKRFMRGSIELRFTSLELVRPRLLLVHPI